MRSRDIAEKKLPKKVKTRLGFEVKNLYTPDDIAELDYGKDLGNPGEYPCTRGIYPDMYQGRLWTMRELSGFGTPEDTREREEWLAKQGTTGRAVIPDLLTYDGLDCDHPLAEAQIGRQGVPLHSLQDMKELFQGVDLEKSNTYIACTGCAAEVVFAQFIAMAEEQGLDLTKLRGTVQTEPIKNISLQYYVAGTPCYELALRSGGDVNEYCVKNMPLWNPMNVQLTTACWGVNVDFELAWALSIVIAHLDEALRRGIDIDSIAPRLSFTVITDVHLLDEVAKLRALRRMWSRLVKERYGAKDPRSFRLRFGCHLGTYPLYPQEILNNIVRLTIETLAAVLGGVQSIEGVCYDEPVCLPTYQSHLVSLRMQQIIAYETGITNTSDPLGGSYYIESLTNRIEEETNKILKQMEEMGGIGKAVESGWLMEKVNKANIDYQKDIQEGKRVKVAVNAFTTDVESQPKVEIQRINPESVKRQREKIKRLKETRDNEKVKHSLRILREKAEIKDGGENLMPYIIEAVKADATTAEILGMMRQAYGFAYDYFGMVPSPV